MWLDRNRPLGHIDKGLAMNATTRRIATTVAGLALAGSAVAATGPAAFAANSQKTPPLEIHTDAGTWYASVYWAADVPDKSVKSVTCTLDGQPLSDCGERWDSGEPFSYVKHYNEVPGGSVAEHTFAVKVLTKGNITYAGSVTFTLAL
jgi:hypothetical protein